MNGPAVDIAAGPVAAPAPSFAEATAAWARIGVLSFGGPAAQIALMHRTVVEEKRWLTERQFLGALSFCMLLPGPEAMQLATYAGWRLHGVRGGLVAGLLFVAPGALVVLALAAVYAAFGTVPLVEAVFFGVKAAVLVIVVEALLRIARRALKGRAHWIIAGLAFAGIFLLALPFPLIVLAAGIWGFVTARGEATLPAGPPARWQGTLRTVAIWLAVWWLPLAAVALAAGWDDILTRVGLFFSQLAVVTFGGAYAVLAYMAQDVVEAYGWLTALEMVDGLGLAETTPGPLILVTEFVGFLAAHRAGGWGMGLAGAAITLWATFAPCFLWIFAGAPWIERITAQPRLAGALAAITAAVVGVILNLAIWFGLHVFFTAVTERTAGPLRVLVPDPATLDPWVVALAVVSGVLLLRLHWSIPRVLGVAALLALAIRLAGI